MTGMLISRTLLVVLLAVLACWKAECSTSVASSQPFEVNAVQSQEGRYNYVVHVTNALAGCTGTLISQHLILTAAHCFGVGFANMDFMLNTIIFKDTTVTFGYNVSEQSTTFLPSPMIAVAVHPAYESASSEYDIAAIRIDLENFNGPPLPFQATPIGHLSKGPLILQGASPTEDILIGVAGFVNSSGGPRCGALDGITGSLSVASNLAFSNSMLQQYEGSGVPDINITNIAVSHIDYGKYDFGTPGRISFLVTVTIATDFYMDPSGIFDNIQPPPAKPSLALKATSVTGNSSTILPFHIINFDALNFKYTLMADNYEVVAKFNVDFLSGHLHMDTSLEIVFKPFGEANYEGRVAEVTADQLKSVLCGQASPSDILLSGLFKASCLKN